MATFHPLDYISLVRRRKWWLIVPAVLCIVATALLAVFLPRVYRSAATITVSSPAISAELLKQAGPLSREERIRAISQQLLSRAVLEQVVRAEHLAPDGNVDAAVDRLLEPNRIKVEPTELLKQVAREGLQLDAFLLSYAGETPGEAQRVADTLARVFVEASSSTRRRGPKTRPRSSVPSSVRARTVSTRSKSGCAGPRSPTWAGCPSRRNRT